jgi:nucleotide-binding universal stress UspA family protein
VYRLAGVATTFSPRFLAVLAEAHRISKAFSVPLHLIHADVPSEEKETRFQEAVVLLGLPPETMVHYQPGKPADAILQVQHRAGIDLLIAGALERETLHRNFTGNVARELMRRTVADLFLFVGPSEQPESFDQIYLALPDFSDLSRWVFGRAVEFAEQVAAKTLTVIQVQTPFSEAKEKALGKDLLPPDERLQSWIAERASLNVQFDYHLIRGNTGFTAFEFIQSSEANLLVMPSELATDGTPVFAPMLDWIIQVIPKNLWVVRGSQSMVLQGAKE